MWNEKNEKTNKKQNKKKMCWKIGNPPSPREEEKNGGRIGIKVHAYGKTRLIKDLVELIRQQLKLQVVKS